MTAAVKKYLLLVALIENHEGIKMKKIKIRFVRGFNKIFN